MKSTFYITILVIGLFLINHEEATSQSFNWLWSKTLNGYSNSSITAITTDASGNVYAIGWYTGTIDANPGTGIHNLHASSGRTNLFVIKLTAYGDFIWVRNYFSNNSSGLVHGNDITIDQSANIYIAGSFSDAHVDFDPGPGFNYLFAGMLETGFITKLDSSGTFVWARAFNSNTSKSEINSIAVEPLTGYIYTTGQYRGTVNFNSYLSPVLLSSTHIDYFDIFITKSDNQGNLIWARSAGGGPSDKGKSIAVQGGNLYLTGEFKGNADFDPGSGNYNLYPVGLHDIFVLKLNTAGNFIWAVKMGGTADDIGIDLALDSLENIYTTGSFAQTADFNPGPGGFPLVSNGISDVFISKLDSAGLFLWARSIGGNGIDIGNSIIIDNKGNGDVWTTGQFYHSADFDPGPGVCNFTSAGGSDIFISRLNSAGDFVWADRKGGLKNDAGNTLVMGDSSEARIAGDFKSPTIWFNNLIDTNANFNGFTTDNFIGKLSCRAAVTVNINACQIYTSPSGKYTWTTSGSYLDTLNTISGCDSVININLSIGTVNSTSTISVATCYYYLSPSSHYTWTTSGTYTDTIPNATGCDSVMTINLTIHNTTTSSVNDTVCHSYLSPSGLYTWTVSGIYSDTIPNANGCDSIITVNLKVNETFSTISDTGCNQYVSPSGNHTWFSSGTYKDTLTNAAGCDSLLTVNLFLRKTYSTLFDTGCYSYIAPSGNYTWTTNGTYLDTLTNAVGCDSILTVHLVFKNSASTQYILTCYSYMPPSGHFTWITSGIYHDSIPNAFGCDSIITYHVTIKTVDTSVTQSGTTLTGPLIGGAFQWLDCDNGFAPIPGQINYAYAPPVDGNYALQVTQNNCIDTSACYQVTGVGITEIPGIHYFEIFPNPAHQHFGIRIKAYQGSAQLTISEITGKTVYSLTVKNNNGLDISTRYFAGGIYFVQLETPDFKETKKLIIYK